MPYAPGIERVVIIPLLQPYSTDFFSGSEEGSCLRLTDFESLNSSFESDKEEEEVQRFLFIPLLKPYRFLTIPRWGVSYEPETRNHTPEIRTPNRFRISGFGLMKPDIGMDYRLLS